jgi:hypothetical protein
MNGLGARYRTMGTLMTELRARLGFVAQGSASKANDLKIKSFLQESHEYVFAQLEPPPQRKKTTIQLQRASFLYDWHNDKEDEDIDPGRVLSLCIFTMQGQRAPLKQGIGPAERAINPFFSWPTRYDTLNGQLEVWPTPDTSYDLVVEYTADWGRFEQPSDRPSVPDRLVFLYALATAKADYRHPDAQAAATAFQVMLDKEKMKQRENRRYFVQGADTPCDAPQVMRLADGSYAWKP